MSRTMTGLLAAALLWGVNPAPCPGEAPPVRRFGPDPRARLEIVGALAAEGSPAVTATTSNPRSWWGIRVHSPRLPWATAFEVASVNLGVWSISHFVLRDPWSNISPETVRQNFKTGLVWDTDEFLMNCLAHPSHGSTYFNTARSSGLSFWESVPFALGGSSMWEAFMENEAPSINDLVFTTCGGVYLGELFNRVSSRILDGRAGGLERAGRELAAFVLNPAGGLHRLFRGDMFRHQPAGSDARGPFETRFVIGRTRLAGDPFVAVTFRSGDPFTGAAGLKAFDYFVHRSRFRFGDSLLFTQSGYGYLGGARFGREGAPVHVLGLFLHFDLRKAEAVRLGASSLTGGLVSKFELGKRAQLETSFQIGATLLGAFDNPQVRTGPWMERDYNFGSGAVAKAEAALSLGKWGTLRTNFAGHCLSVLEGTPGIDRAAFLEASYEIPVYKSLTVGVEVVDVRRHSSYRDASGIQARYADCRLIAGIGF